MKYFPNTKFLWFMLFLALALMFICMAGLID
jgi:hypothetical protein